MPCVCCRHSQLSRPTGEPLPLRTEDFGEVGQSADADGQGEVALGGLADGRVATHDHAFGGLVLDVVVLSHDPRDDVGRPAAREPQRTHAKVLRERERADART